MPRALPVPATRWTPLAKPVPHGREPPAEPLCHNYLPEPTRLFPTYENDTAAKTARIIEPNLAAYATWRPPAGRLYWNVFLRSPRNSAMTRIAILGATGYTALELIKILLRHPEAEIVAVTSRQEGQPPIAMIHPSLTGRLDLPLGGSRARPRSPPGPSASSVACRTGPARRSIPHAAGRRRPGGRFQRRLPAERRRSLRPVVRPEARRSRPAGQGRLRAARAVPRADSAGASWWPIRAVIPTSAILALAPLLKAGLIEPKTIIVDSKSGVSGAGRTPKLTTHYPECNESISAYNVGRHRHTPEIEQVLEHGRRHAGRGDLHAAPGADGPRHPHHHLLPAHARRSSEEKVLQTLRDFYADEPFVRVVDHLPGTKDSLDTNFCDITARVVRGRVLTISCLDNLIKGAAGAAVQNFNLMFGYPGNHGAVKRIGICGLADQRIDDGTTFANANRQPCR